MSSNTTNLNLYKKDPTVDGNDTFNIKTMLNDNWDKIDAAIISKVDKVDFSSHLADNTKHVAKDGTLQMGLNAEKINGKTAIQTPQTVEKTDLVGMVNELFQNANNGKTSVANAIGLPSVATETFTQLTTDIQNLKNGLATNLTNKGQPSSGTDTLNNLVAKVAKISTGKRWTSGTVSVDGNVSSRGWRSGYNISINISLPFVPTIVYLNFKGLPYNYFQSKATYCYIFPNEYNPNGYIFQSNYSNFSRADGDQTDWSGGNNTAGTSVYLPANVTSFSLNYIFDATKIIQLAGGDSYYGVPNYSSINYYAIE